MHATCDRNRRRLAAIAAVLWVNVIFIPETIPAQMRPVELTLVDDEAIGYATFQSHNQKVVANEHGVFLTHLRTRNEAYTAQTWRLSRSRDQGQTFETIYEDTHATNPPVLETDSAGNIYLIRVDFQLGDAFLYRFSPASQFTTPRITRIPGAAAGKYAMILDEPNECLYFFAHNNTFHRVKLDGSIEASTTLLAPGAHAVLQYPLLSLDGGGRLHAAWTTQKHGVYLYWDIHHMVSRDGGALWHNLDGTQLSIPVIADDTGNAHRVIQDDEFESHTWLSSLAATGGKVHFVYLAQTTPPRQHYIRYDIATGKRDVHIEPVLRGAEIELRGLDSFFIVDSLQPETLFCVGHDTGRLACLRSEDNGATWHDFARSEEEFHLYSVGGFRRTTDDGLIIGTFTDQHGSNTQVDRGSAVYFFRIPTAQVEK